MRRTIRMLLLGWALVGSWNGVAEARSPHAHAHHAVRETELLDHRHYTNVDGHVVHSPAHTRTGRAPAGWTAQCGDGSYSFSEHHQGTCSHHGGVSAWR